jgi:hypothetical protein
MKARKLYRNGYGEQIVAVAIMGTTLLINANGLVKYLTVNSRERRAIAAARAYIADLTGKDFGN